MEFSRPEYWSGETFPSPGDIPNPGIKPRSPTLQADSLPAEPQGKSKNTGVGRLPFLQQIFPTQKSNQGLLHCRWILNQLRYQGSPVGLSMLQFMGLQRSGLNFATKQQQALVHSSLVALLCHVVTYRLTFLSLWVNGEFLGGTEYVSFTVLSIISSECSISVYWMNGPSLQARWESGIVKQNNENCSLKQGIGQSYRFSLFLALDFLLPCKWFCTCVSQSRDITRQCLSLNKH